MLICQVLFDTDTHSVAGLFFELGPCSIKNEGKNTTYNPYSWNEKANMIFLDSPIGVGYSYAENGESVNNSVDTAKDVYAFLQLFVCATYMHRVYP